MLENGLTKDHSKILQGLAVLMMLYFHLFTTEFEGHISLLNIAVDGMERKVAIFCRICTAMFAMISGYGMYRSCNGCKFNSIKDKFIFDYKKVIKHLIVFYKMYWMVFIVFVPIRFVYGFSFDIKEFIGDFIGLTYNYNPSWWYVHQYVVMMLLFPIIDILFWFFLDKIKKWLLAAIIIVGCLTVCLIPGLFEITMKFININCISYLIIFMCAMLISKYKIYEKIYKVAKSNRLISYILPCLVLILSILARYYASGNDIIAHQYDFIIAPAFCYSVISLLKNEKIIKLLCYFGKYSMYMWLIHTFIYLVYWKEFIALFKYSFIMYVVLVMVSLVLSIAFSRIYDLINKKKLEKGLTWEKSK